MPGVLESEAPKREPNRLILCFDGTGNEFTGSNGDTNVVKLLNKLDRNHAHQYHYYQTGIGTYSVNETSINNSWFGKLRTSVTKTIDQGVATTFDAHVIAGYRFLMRYYESGDKIYLFGFSRGAFTAKFLARMINTVGLLCKGNEEMVPFAFRLYQRYLAGLVKETEAANGTASATNCKINGSTSTLNTQQEPSVQNINNIAEEDLGDEYKQARNEIKAFKNTFCRKDQKSETELEKEIKVFFLGIWDCVNSVAVLEKSAPHPVAVKGTAQYVRHAVSVDERRVKFKPALLAQDIRSSDHPEENIKEVWFPGNHGDVGGGWPSNANEPLDNNEKMTTWQKVKNFFMSRKPDNASKDVRQDQYQLSDVPLAWMIRELELVGKKHPTCAVKWTTTRVEGFKVRFQERKKQALQGFIHDPLKFGYGTAFLKVVFWWFLEYNPFITRWELEQNKWVPVRFPLNKGAARDIPVDAELHESLRLRVEKDKAYWPTNNHGGRLPPCLKNGEWTAKFEPVPFRKGEDEDPDHQTWTFASTSGA